MNTSTSQSQSSIWFGTIILFLLVIACVIGIVSIYFNNGNWLTYTQLVISVLGILTSTTLVKILTSIKLVRSNFLGGLVNSRWLRILNGIIVILLIVVIALQVFTLLGLQSKGLGSTSPTPTPTIAVSPTPPKVAITFPTERSTVGTSIIAQGTASNIPQGENLWLLVYVEGINGYYPQDGPINVLSDGTWSASVTIGGPNDAGRHFVLLATQADQEGETTLEQYIKLGNTTNSFPTIPLPKGVREITLVHITRM